MRIAMAYVYEIAENDDYLLMLNDDVIIGPTYVASLVKDSIKSQGAIVGSLQLDQSSNLPFASGYKIDYWRMCIRSFRAPHEIPDALPGRGVLFPMRAARAAGVIHRLLPHYLGDLEFTARVKEMGNRLMVSSSAAVSTTQDLSPTSVNPRGAINGWFSGRSPRNVWHRLVFFLVRGPFLLRILAAPRFLIIAIYKIVSLSV